MNISEPATNRKRDFYSSSERPTSILALPTNMPAVLTTLPIWINWDFYWEKSIWKKKLKDPKPGFSRNAKTNEPSTWGTMAEAITKMDDDTFEGIACVITKRRDILPIDLVGIDLDDCRDKDTGVIDQWAIDIIKTMNTYCETSPSGTGVKMICEATWPEESVPCGRNFSSQQIEIYREKFWCMTGHRLPGLPATIERRDAELTALWDRVSQAERNANKPAANGAALKLTATSTSSSDDGRYEKYLAKCERSILGGNGKKSGSDELMRTIRKFVSKFKTDYDTTLLSITLYYNPTRCNPPWSDKELRHKVDDVFKRGTPTPTSNGTPPAPSTSAAPPTLITRPASSYTVLPVDWVWRGRIPRGALTVLEGDPGLGKSKVTIDMAARVSRGLSMPLEDVASDPAAAIILSAEDDPARTIRPRLEAAGADLDMVHIVEAVRVGDDDDRLPVLPLDLAALEAFVVSIEARLVIVDPIMAFLGDGIDSHKDQSIRSALRQFAKLAERTQCAVIIIRHLNKMSGGSAIYRGGGSIGIVGAARSALLLAKHPEDPDSRVLASVKSNLGPRPRSIVMSCEPVGDVSVAAWGQEIDMDADDLLGEPAKRKIDKCQGAIADLLSGGKMKSADFEAELAKLGYKPRSIATARKALGVRSSKSSYDGSWWVELPTKTANDELAL